MMTIRMILSLLAAGFIMSVEFGFLWSMIHVRGAVEDLRPATKIEFTRMRTDSAVQTLSREKPKILDVPVKPDVPQIAENASASAATAVAKFELAPGAESVDLTGTMSQAVLALSGTDHDVVPLVRIPPDYPERAENARIEGWVEVEFTIAPSGLVQDARAVDSEPKGYFEQAAVRSVMRWRYSPMTEGGVASERRNHRVVIRFKLGGST